MPYRVAFYCPDRHLVYDGRTPDEFGVGGGVTARVRLARALARSGHRVINIVNCREREVIDGVEYLPLDRTRAIDADVLILNTSGGAYDLRPILDMDCRARLRLVWVHGIALPAGLGEIRFDGFVAVSNFVADAIRSAWDLRELPVFVAYNGFEEEHFAAAERESPAHDPFRLVYFSHPSKGLDTAIDVLQRLRAHDERYHLAVFGGARLWGQPEVAVPGIPGVMDRGLIGQRALARELLRSTFSVQMQDRQEPGALAIVDALRAGCVILSSPVGCYPETIVNGVNGFLVEGNHLDDEPRGHAAGLIRALRSDPGRLELLSAGARDVPWSIDVMARVWSGYLGWRLGADAQAPASACSRCAAMALSLADGVHCTQCGNYARADVDETGGDGHG
ncbi:MAG: glycosyltransferase family 4 protein [Actinobacteria bacterium]|nr:glycosyltransferase family 4 protein [Actinomycetota bacterium]